VYGIRARKHWASTRQLLSVQDLLGTENQYC
jgi:hypothetical protein